MVQEECGQLRLVLARCAEVTSGGPVTEEGADTAPAAGDNGLADAVYHGNWAEVR